MRQLASELQVLGSSRSADPPFVAPAAANFATSSDGIRLASATLAGIVSG
jgi:hypothetical protein